MSKTNVGLSAIYDGGLAPGIMIGAGRHRGSKRHHGRGVMDTVRKVHDILKGNKIISRVGSKISPKLGEFAAKHGYGRRRKGHRRRRVRRHHGGSKRRHTRHRR